MMMSPTTHHNLLFVTKITEHLYIIMRLADENLKKKNKYFDL